MTDPKKPAPEEDGRATSKVIVDVVDIEVVKDAPKVDPSKVNINVNVNEDEGEAIEPSRKTTDLD